MTVGNGGVFRLGTNLFMRHREQGSTISEERKNKKKESKSTASASTVRAQKRIIDVLAEIECVRASPYRVTPLNRVHVMNLHAGSSNVADALSRASESSCCQENPPRSTPPPRACSFEECCLHVIELSEHVVCGEERKSASERRGGASFST